MSYIESEALLKSLESKRLIFEESTPVDEAIAEQVSVFVEAIEEAPTADMVEVRHGKWIDTGDRELDTIYSGYKCSVCGFIICGHSGKYCSDCGAKMDGERSENGKS